MNIVELPTMPSVAQSWARALTRTWRRTGLGPHLAPRPPTGLRVRGVQPDATRLSAYQHLIGEPGTDTLSAGFCYVLASPLAMAVLGAPGSDLPLIGLIHIRNEIVVHRPVMLGEPLDITVSAEPAHPHRRGTAVDIVGEIRVADEVVWTDRSTYLSRSGPSTGKPHPKSQHLESPPVQTGEWRVPADEGHRYAAVSGDRNPIHLSRIAARLFGFQGPIVHGMDSAARLLAMTTPHGPLRWTVEFTSPIPVGSTVAIGIRPDPTGVDIAMWRRDGRIHVKGRID